MLMIRDGDVVKIDLVDGEIAISSSPAASTAAAQSPQAPSDGRPEARTLETLDDAEEIEQVEPDEIRRRE